MAVLMSKFAFYAETDNAAAADLFSSSSLRYACMSCMICIMIFAFISLADRLTELALLEEAAEAVDEIAEVEV
jgi:hypothetical protein